MSGSEEQSEILELRLLFGNMFIFGMIMLLGSWSWFVGAHNRQTSLLKLIEDLGLFGTPILAVVMFFACLCTTRWMTILFALMNMVLALLLSFLIFVCMGWRDFPHGYN